jgi:hypothetical protein
MCDIGPAENTGRTADILEEISNRRTAGAAPTGMT